MKTGGLLDAIIELSQERGLDQAIVIEALEDAIVGAAYRKYKNYRNIEAEFNQQSGKLELTHFKTVTENVEDPDNQVALGEVLTFDPEAEVGDELEYEIDANDFKDVIAQTARQLVFQKINEAEREAVLEKYRDKVGEIVHGTVARIERNRVVIMIAGTVEAALERREQIPHEKLEPGEHVRAQLLELRSEGRGPQLVLTRTHPNFLMKLMEVEVPEVFDGIIDVIAASREPGRRAKIAVRSNELDVDPVGACVGVKGSRIQAVVSELSGERIDVIEYSENIAQFIANALAPAEIMEMELSEDEKSVDIKVATDQLSLAIGKQGQNVRLASRLTEVSININAWDDADIEDPFAEAEARQEAAEIENAANALENASPSEEPATEATEETPVSEEKSEVTEETPASEEKVESTDEENTNNTESTEEAGE